MPRHHQKQGRRPRRRPFSISHTAEPIPASPAVQGTITDPNNDLTTDGYETTEIVETFPLNTADEMQDAFEYDAAGNLTFDGKAKYTYDAYNRLIMVQQAYKDPTVASGALQEGSTLGEYAYDGHSGGGRRIRKDAYTADGLDNVEHFYYTGWSVVETRNGSDQVTQQHVWDNLAGHYIDSLAQVANNTNPTVDDEVDEDFYALQDQQFNVLAITDNAGSIVERYEYTLYGERTVMNPQHVVRGDSAYGMVMGFQGLFHDVEIDAVQNRTRIYLPTLGIFGQQDIRGGLYPDGLNTYAAYHVMWGGVDPMGLLSGPSMPMPAGGGGGSGSSDCDAEWENGPELRFTNWKITGAKKFYEHQAEGRMYFLDNTWLTYTFEGNFELYGKLKCCCDTDEFYKEISIKGSLQYTHLENTSNRLFKLNKILGFGKSSAAKYAGWGMMGGVYIAKTVDIFEQIDQILLFYEFVQKLPLLQGIIDEYHNQDILDYLCQSEYDSGVYKRWGGSSRPPIELGTFNYKKSVYHWLTLPGENEPQPSGAEMTLPDFTGIPDVTVPLPPIE